MTGSIAQPNANTGSLGMNFEAGVLEAVGQSVIVTDLDSTIIYWNRFAETVYGWSSAEALGRNIGELLVPEASKADSQDIMPRLLRGQSWSGEFVVRRRDGTSFPCLVTDSPLQDASGKLVGVIGVSFDNSARKQAEEAQARLAAIVTCSEDAIIATSLDGTITDWNEGATALHGYTAVEMIGRPVSLLSPPEYAAETSNRRARIVAGESFEHVETVRLHKDGRRLDLSVSITPIRAASGAIVGVARIGRDITEQKRASADLASQAQHDALTGLPNRGLLHTRLQHVLVTTEGVAALPVALLLLDLDRFKEVNDTLGHHVGDRLLQQIGQRLQGAVRTADLVARLGGDEFAVLLPNTDAAGAGHVAEALGRALQTPFMLEGQPIVVDASIGIALAPDHGQDADTLLRCSDVAMYEAKRSGTDIALYCAANDQHSTERLALLGELRYAIDHDQLRLCYQPKLDLHEGKLVGVEALVRWQHPQRGFLPPSEFIPLAEQTGLIYPLSRWVLDAALEQQQAWHGMGIDVPVAVNLSRRSLHDTKLPERVAQALARWQVPPGSLVLEITESSLLTEPERAGQNLKQLRSMGVRISIDDFGTGFSSMACLKNLSVDELKIDQSFVQAMATDASSRAIVRAIIDLGDALNLRVVAEGIEDRATWDVLVGLGCEIAQGYFVSRPIDGVALEAWVRTMSPAWLEVADSSSQTDALQERIRGRGARLTAEEEFIARKRAEAALRASEESNRLALEAAGIGTWDWDVTRDVLTWSSKTEALSGVAPGSFAGTFAAYRQTIHAEDWPAMEVEFAAAVAERREFLSTYRPLWPDGSVHWLAGIGRGLYAADGSMVRMTGTLMDITERKHAEEALRVSEERNRLALEAARMGTWDYDVPQDALTFSTETEALHGLEPGAFEGTFAAFKHAVHSDDWSAVEDEIHACQAEHRGTFFTYRTVWPDGSVHWVETKGRAIYAADGTLLRLSGTSMDITDRKLADQALRAGEERYRRIMEQAGDGIFLVDTRGAIIEANPSACTILGYAPDELLDRELRGLIVADDVAQRPLRMQGLPVGTTVRTERRMVRKDSSQVTVDVSATMLAEGVMLGIIRDNSERAALEEQLRYRAFHDSLTGLPNRALFLDRLAQATARAERSGDRLAVLFLDLDGFKLINDSLGHAAGDELLVAVARRLQLELRQGDTLARFGGDEFTVLLDDLTSTEAPTEVAERLLESLRRPVLLAEKEAYVSASLGIATNVTGSQPDDLLREADIALYQAKAAGKGGHAQFVQNMHRWPTLHLDPELEDVSA